MNCPHRINGPLNAAGAFRHCKQGGKKKGRVGGGYNQPSVHIAEVLGFITEAEGQIDGILS